MLNNDFPIPNNEDDRLAALKSYNIMDTPAEERFDNLTLLAGKICEALFVSSV
ncbi:MAG: hypothetical protein ACI857_000261 [Arenicella sp.]|jgi:hypothetical protein